MEWLSKMNSAIEYIEKNLTDDIDYDVLSRKACTSSYNFQRMFSFITDITLAEYIRRRRITQAALDLQESDLRVIDIAIKYGYKSATSFTRAFVGLQGITPTEARRAGVKLKAFPRISFRISIKGEREMDYRIEKKEGFQIFGIETIASLTNEQGYLSPAQLWKKCHENGEYERLYSNAGNTPDFLSEDICKVHGVENYRKTDVGKFSYMLCAFVSNESNIEGYKVVDIPSQTYVIFSSKKFNWEEDLQAILLSLQKRFYTEWLPTANYERAEGPNFEIYGGTPEEGYIEAWYPVIKKKRSFDK